VPRRHLALALSLLMPLAVPASLRAQTAPLPRHATVGIIGTPGGEFAYAFPGAGLSAGMGVTRQLGKALSLRIDGELMRLGVDDSFGDEGGAIGAGASVHAIRTLPLSPISSLRPYVGVGASTYAIVSSSGPVGGDRVRGTHLGLGVGGILGWEFDIGGRIAFGEIGINAYAGDVNSYIPIRFGLRL